MDKVVLITGGSRGIGAEIAVEFAKIGFKVAFTYNSDYESAISVLEKSKNFNHFVEVYKCDVSDKNSVDNMINGVISSFGHIDVLINNAGVSHEALFTDTTEDDWDRVFKVNVRGVFNCTKGVLPEMIKRHSGNIINISSMWGQVGASCEVIYSASKSAIIGFTKALAKEVGPSGINVNCICPGIINTDMLNSFSDDDIDVLKQQTPLKTIGMPIDIANMTTFLASENSRFITGQVFGVNGGFVI